MSINLSTQLYLEQVQHWPMAGRHILANYDEQTIVVYQAFSADIAHFAVDHGYFGGSFRLNRMSWLKPNFLWMMYRAGWGTKPGQEHILAIRITRSVFETILQQAVHSHYLPTLYNTKAVWQQALTQAEVRLQWDPDHDPKGKNLQRRAIQLGLRGHTLRQYANEWLIGIEDITAFVAEQRQHVEASMLTKLITPVETLYPIIEPSLRKMLDVSG